MITWRGTDGALDHVAVIGQVVGAENAGVLSNIVGNEMLNGTRPIRRFLALPLRTRPNPIFIPHPEGLAAI